MSSIDWHYNYSDDPVKYSRGHRQVEQFLKQIASLPLAKKLRMLEAAGYPESDPSVAWVKSRIIREAAVTESVEYIKMLVDDIRYGELFEDKDPLKD